MHPHAAHTVGVAGQQSNEIRGFRTLSCLNSLRSHPGAVGNVLSVPRTSGGGSIDARGLLHVPESRSRREPLLPLAPVPLARGGGIDRRLCVHCPSEVMSVPEKDASPSLAGGGSIEARLCVQPSEQVPARDASVFPSTANLFSTETGSLRGTGSDAALPLQPTAVKAVAPGSAAALNASLPARALVCRVRNST